MTWADYMLAARGKAFSSLHKYDRQVARIYLDLAAQVNEELQRTKPGLTRFHLQQVLRSLSDAAADTQKGYEGLIDKALREAAGIHTDYWQKGMSEFWEALDQRAGLTMDTAKLTAFINREAVEILYARTFDDGLFLSDRIWKVGQASRQGLAKIVTQGFTRGLHYDDPRIAEQVRRFLQPARLGTKVRPTITRELKDGTKFTFRQRPVSFDAARLLRTEYSEAFKQSSLLSAQRNPACTGERWVLSAEHPLIGCDCEDYAQHDEGLGEGVFSLGNLPVTPHAQCLCTWETQVCEMAVFNEWIDQYMKNGTGRIAKWAKEDFMEMAA